MQNQVEEIKAKTDIVAIIGEYVALQKAGRNYKGLCPFHAEKTPSFMVSSELQIFKCFGCGESGDVISFLEKYEGMEFYEALSFLADKAGIKLKAFSGNEKSQKEIFIEVNTLAVKFYHYILLNHKFGRPALKYLTEKRKISMESIKTFSLGASPNGPAVLESFLVKKKKYKHDFLEEAGLIVRTRVGFMDRFRGRVIFPIYDHRGATIALGGRILPQIDKNFAKYINSPETPVYHKSNSLYGIHLAKKYIKEAGYSVIVEGELDLISAWQAGIRNIVAIKGTALTEEQVRLLGRFTKSIRLALDSDFAGDAASIRSISLATELGMDVKVIKIEKYKDPDEFAQQDPHGFIRQIENPVDIWDFIIEVISSRYDLSKGSGKAMASREIVPVLAKISDKIIQAHYSKLVAEKLAVPVEAVAEEVNSYIERGKSEASKFDPLLKTQAKARREVLEERLLALILKSEPERQAIGEWQKIVKTHFVKRLLDELSEYLKAWPEFKILDFVNSLPSELLDSTRTLILIDVGDEDLDKEILEVINEINLIDINERMEAAQNKIAVLEKAGKKEELKKVKKEFALLARERSEFGH